MLPTCRGRRNIWVRIRKVLPEIKAEQLVAATEEDRTMKLKWWGYGLEIISQATHLDIQKILYEIEIQENILKIIVEGVDQLLFM